MAKRAPRGCYWRGVVLDDKGRQIAGTLWGLVTISRRKHRRSLRTADPAEARRRYQAWRKELIAAAHFGLERPTWQEAVIAWGQAGFGGAKPRTVQRYLTSLRMVDPILGALYLDQINRRALGQVASRPGVTNASRRRDLTAVSAVLRHAVGEGWLDFNPAKLYDRDHIRERRDPIVLPSVEDIATFIAACPNQMMATLARFLLLTGMRLDEAVQLEHRQIGTEGITLYRTKTDRPRVVPLVPAARDLLAGLPVRLGCPYVFWSGRGLPMGNVSSRLAAVKRRRGLTFRVHDLRHRFAVDYLRRGGSIYDLQGILGHGSIKTTEIYLRYLTPEQAREAMRIGA